MDNAGFKEEIKKAAEELRDLFRDSSGQPPNSRLWEDNIWWNDVETIADNQLLARSYAVYPLYCWYLGL